MNKEERKQILRELRADERRRAIAALPAPLASLQTLLDSVDERVVAHGCRHTLSHTQAAAGTCGLDWTDTLEAWLHEHGGFCDCEVVLNVGSHVDQLTESTLAP